jgi:hypothetical protein
MRLVIALGWFALAGCEKDASHPRPPPTPPPPPPVIDAVVAPTYPDCSASYAPDPTKDPTPMCRVPAGRFVMDKKPGDPDGDLDAVIERDVFIDETDT